LDPHIRREGGTILTNADPQSEMIKALADQAFKTLVDWEQKLILSASVGNGAALVVLGGALLNGWKLNLFTALLPALWMFSAGLILAGVAPLTALNSYTAGHLGLALRALGGTDGDNKDKYSKYLDTSHRHNKITMRLVFASGSAFVLGIIWPITIITFFPKL
jgi:hypothetical protein